MALKLSNNAISRLASAITADATSISLAAGTGSRFPTLGVGDHHPATLSKSDGSFEIVKVTARSGDTLTATRAQEGTTALSFDADSLIEIRITAGTFDSITGLDTSNDLTISGLTIGKGGGANSSNTALGFKSLESNTSGFANLASGYYTLYKNKTGYANVALGHFTLYNNVSGEFNVAAGYGALEQCTTGVRNVANGCFSLQNLTTGFSNVSIGHAALAGLTTGFNNTAVGHLSGLDITTGTQNTILGNFTGNQYGLDIRELSNYLVLSDGNGNPRIYHNGTTVVIPNLPTSATGLSAGSLWKDENGFLKVV